MGLIKRLWSDFSFLTGGAERMKYWDGLTVWYVATETTWPLGKDSYTDRQELYGKLKEFGLEWRGRIRRWTVARGAW